MKHTSINLYNFFSIIIGVSLVATPLICSKIKSGDYKKQMLENPTITTGKVIDFLKAYKRTDAFKFTFSYGDKIFESYSSSEGSQDDYGKLYSVVRDKSFPVIFNLKDPQKYSTILIVPEDFKYYGLNFPDSLKWVLKYIDR